MSAERTPKWGRHDLNTHKEALHLPSPRQPPSAGFSQWFWERSSRRIVIGRHVTQTRSAAHDVHISSLFFHLNVLDFTTRSIQSHVTNLSLLLLLLWQRIVKETHNYLLNNGPLSSKHRPTIENNCICPMESNNNISGGRGNTVQLTAALKHPVAMTWPMGWDMHMDGGVRMAPSNI